MTSRCSCAQAETLAGAIALGEAAQAQLDLYRAHLATCGRCRSELGGERDIERVMATAPAARATERWEPDLRTAAARPRMRSYVWQSAVTLAAAFAVVFGIQAMAKHPAAPAVPEVRASSAQAERAIAALDNQTAPRREHAAESLVVGSTTPQTMGFTVSFDERGTPTGCAVTKSSGRRTLDRAVCRAAMRPLYAPAPSKRP